MSFATLRRARAKLWRVALEYSRQHSDGSAEQAQRWINWRDYDPWCIEDVREWWRVCLDVELRNLQRTHSEGD